MLKRKENNGKRKARQDVQNVFIFYMDIIATKREEVQNIGTSQNIADGIKQRKNS